MPLYEYEDIATGQRVEMCRPVDARDDVPPGLRRITVPRRLGVLTGVLDECDVDRAAPRGFRQLEETMPAREIARQTGFSIDHIKRVWAMCLAVGFVTLGALGADISSGYVFLDAEENITAAKLNAVVGGAVINPTFLTLKTAATNINAADQILLYSWTAQGLRRTTVNDLLYGNAALITSQTEVYTPNTNDYLLLYDSTNAGNRKVQVSGLFTNWMTYFQPAPSLTALAIATNNTRFLVWDNGTNGGFGTNGGYGAMTMDVLSTYLAPTNFGPYTAGVFDFDLAHGHTNAPSTVRWVLVSDGSDQGYAAGDEIDISCVLCTNSSVAGWVPALIGGANATNIFLFRSDAAAGEAFRLANKTVGTWTGDFNQPAWQAKCYVKW